MSGRGQRGHPDFHRGAPPNRGGLGGDYYGGPGYGYNGAPTGYLDHRESRPPPTPGGGRRGRYNDDRGPPPRTRRRPVPPGVIVFHSLEEERDWVEDRRRRRLSRPTKFDLTYSTSSNEGFHSATIMSDSNTGSWSTSTKSFPHINSISPQEFALTAPDTVPQQTRHARRLYVGNLPQFITEEQIHRVFRDAIRQALVIPSNGEKLPFSIEEDPILSVYINRERRFCFLEFKSVELCSSCMALDGLEVVPGQPPVKVKRPNDFNASMAPKLSSIPELDVSRLGIISPTVLDGPNKIFIGGLHYHMAEGQVLELLQAFGKVKAFHLVKNDPDSATSKGYCFGTFYCVSLLMF
jgi:RNA recognition motif. (a.k.a. RRM, RBD, or RNP domain)